MSIKDTGKTYPKIVDIGPKAERIDPKEVAKALGATIVCKVPKGFPPIPPPKNIRA